MRLPDPETCARLARDVAPRWIWFAGMLATSGGESARVTYAGAGVIMLNRHLPVDILPDLTDPLTAAGTELVLHVIDPDVEVGRYQGAWAATRPPVKGAPGLAGMLPGIVARGATKLEALIAAILAAPEKP